MNTFWKATAIILITVILVLVVGKQEKDMAVLLSMAACCLVAVTASVYLEPVFDLLHKLEEMGKMESGSLSILLKAVGVAIVSELAEMVCNDAANAALAKTLQFLSKAAILYLSIPLFEAFLTMIQEILGQL